MRRDRPLSLHRVGLLSLCGVAILAAVGRAQPPNQGSLLPQPRLMSVMPPGGKAGSTVEVSFTGTDLDDPQNLLFSHPGIKAEASQPPAPAAADPNPPRQRGQQAPRVTTKFKVTIPADAPVGIHDVRFVNRFGVSNPRAFAVGDLADVMEKEANNDIGEAQRVELNTTVNGAISSPTDVDFVVFAGKKGQRVLASCLTSSLDSRLLGSIELYDAKGRLLGHGRSYQENDSLADAVLPADGDYYVRLCEFTYTQGSAEHFYRLSITTAPWIDAIYPPVVEPGKPAKLTVYGRNLPEGKPDPSTSVGGSILETMTVNVNVPNDPVAVQRLAFNGRVPPKASWLDGFEYRVRNAAGSSNPFLLAYARAPVVIENTANDTAETPQEVPLPCEIVGQVEKKHDKDWYAFTAKKGEAYSVEVLSDRLGAPTAMHFLLRNPANKQDIFETPPENNDILSIKYFARTEDPAPYKFTAPADGKYLLRVTSRTAEVLAGPRHYYRVRITPEQPDFRLVVLGSDNYRPDSVTLGQGGSQCVTVFVWRLDGFAGEINLSAEGLPQGVTCAPQVIGAGMRQAALVLTAAADAPAWTGEIKIKGTATIKGQPVVREARAGSIVWPVQPMQNIPLLGRLDRGVALAVRDKAPFILDASLPKTALLQGEKVNLAVKLTRQWADFKGTLQVQALTTEQPNQFVLPTGVVTINNNQPVTIAADKTDATLNVDVKANAPTGKYTLIVRGTAQVPFSKDPMAKQKPNINAILPATPVTITVLPKTVANVSLATPNPMVKAGMQTELVVKVARQNDYAGEFKVQLVLPKDMKGVSAADVTIPAGQNEAKVVLKADADAAPGNRADLVVRATATLEGAPIPHEVKFNVNVVK